MAHTVWGLILACGKEEELSQNVDTAFLSLGDNPLIVNSIQEFEGCDEIDGIAVVCRKERMQEVKRLVELFGFSKVRRIAAGTTQRLSSVKAGLQCFDENVSICVIHEGSRPFVKRELIGETVKAAKRYGCGIAATRPVDVIKTSPKGHKISKTLDPNTVWIAQTPQAFKIDVLLKAIESAAKKKATLYDEATAMELFRKDVHVVASTVENFKVNSPESLKLAHAMQKM